MWDILQVRGFIDGEAVMRRMGRPVVTALREAFLLFDYAHDLSDTAATGPNASFSSETIFGRFKHVVTWLVVLILRTDAYCEMFGADSWPLFPPFTILMKDLVNRTMEISENVPHDKKAGWKQSGTIVFLC